jgi:glycosyltransferase involved in cell wall biosynthesis
LRINGLNQSTNIVHTPGFPLDFNGNLSRVFGEAIHVARLGYNVDVILSNQVPLKNLKEVLENGVKIHRARAIIPGRRIGWRANNIFPLFLETLKVLKNNSNQILHIAAPTPVTKPLTVSELGKSLKKPMVLDLHDPWSADPFSSNFFLMLQTHIMKRIIKGADYVIVAHTALMDLVRKITKDVSVDVIPYGVDTERFRPIPRNLLIAEDLNIDENDVVIAFSGHIIEDKGLDVLIRSSQVIQDQHKNVKFLVIGDGPARPKAEHLVDKLQLREIFRFVGFVSQEEVIQYLSLADICVAPYKAREWFRISLPETPLKVVEYMALGKPVLMSRISDENVVSWSGGGSLVTPGNVSELASMIIDLIDQEGLRKAQGRKAREYVEENLSWTKIAEKLVEAYESVLAA